MNDDERAEAYAAATALDPARVAESRRRFEAQRIREMWGPLTPQEAAGLRAWRERKRQ